MEPSPKSPRHCFYQPQGESTRALAGFTPPPVEEPKPEPTILEDHEPYYDDEEQDLGGAGFADVPAPPKMMPMSVATGGDYEAGSDDGTQRKACFAAVVSVCFLVLGYWITIGRHGSNGSHHGYSSGGGSGHSHFGWGGSDNHHVDGECSKEGFDATYFADLLERVEQLNQTELCTTEFPIHKCKCKNPFLPKANDIHPGWLKVLDMNVDLMKKNFTSRGLQPDVVIYGDSITEHLIGRNYGMPVDIYQGHAAVTHELLAKRGGGLINGLPMGIAADQMAHLLYRIQHGEMPQELHPEVWWVMIGTNDIGFGCSIEAVVAGNIRIVKEIRERHNNQHGHKTLTPVVLNSILPRGKFDLHSDQSAYQIIRRVNRQLDCYAQLVRGVYFVNVTDTVSETLTNGTYLKQDYFTGDHLHLSAEGSRQWEELIVSNVMQLMS